MSGGYTEMNEIQKFLSECRSIEAKCTAGPWKAGCTYNHAQDAEFIAFSRNNFLKLVECVSVLSEACEYYIGRSGSRVAQQTLEKVEEILK